MGHRRCIDNDMMLYNMVSPRKTPKSNFLFTEKTFYVKNIWFEMVPQRRDCYFATTKIKHENKNGKGKIEKTQSQNKKKKEITEKG